MDEWTFKTVEVLEQKINILHERLIECETKLGITHDEEADKVAEVKKKPRASI